MGTQRGSQSKSDEELDTEEFKDAEGMFETQYSDGELFM
jgi:hypothetical protein